MNLALREESRAARCVRVRGSFSCGGQQQVCYLRGWNVDDDGGGGGKVEGERPRGVLVISY